jgi:hypothetical protein
VLQVSRDRSYSAKVCGKEGFQVFCTDYLCIKVRHACEFGILNVAQWWKKHGGSVAGRRLKVKSKVKEKQMGRDAYLSNKI